jgi:quercetin dioxygenase-like cupin family protein
MAASTFLETHMTPHAILSIATSALLALLGSGAALAQDAAVVNSATVHVRLDNAHVRVLESVLGPGQKERVHSHPACVIYVIAGGKVRNHTADGKSADSELIAGATAYREPITHWSENIGTTPVHLILVELKDQH